MDFDENREESETREERDDREDLIEGRNAVIEALRAGRLLDKVYIQKGETDKTLGHIASRARDAGVVVVIAGAVVSVLAYRLTIRLGRLPEPQRWFG